MHVWTGISASACTLLQASFSWTHTRRLLVEKPYCVEINTNIVEMNNVHVALAVSLP